MEESMADVNDIVGKVADARSWILEDGGAAAGIRTFDGIAELLIEVIRELRNVTEAIERQRGNDA